jgi:NADH-quinone oxidoreductase subunit L
MTHAFFKACLFLGAGSVILGMHHEQDLRRMGGLRTFMPKTFATFALATIAIMGIPPFSGFFSKDEILWQAWKSEHGHPVLWLAGFLTAGITAFYMSRLLFLTFFGENRRRQAVHDGHHLDEHETHGHRDAHAIRESPSSMTVPLVILAVFSVMAGFIGVPAALGGSNRFAHFLGPVLGLHGHAPHDPLEYLFMLASVGMALAGSGLAYLFYMRKTGLPRLLAEKLAFLHRLVSNKYYIDELYGFVFVSGAKAFSRALAFFDKYVVDFIVNLSGLALRTQSRIAGWFDDAFVDGAVNFVADSTLSIGDAARRVQTGRVQLYILVLVLMVALGIVVKIFSA